MAFQAGFGPVPIRCQKSHGNAKRYAQMYYTNDRIYEHDIIQSIKSNPNDTPIAKHHILADQTRQSTISSNLDQTYLTHFHKPLQWRP